MKKMMLLCVISLNLLNSYSFAHSSSNHGQSDSGNVNWGNGPGNAKENQSPREETSKSDSINWGNGPQARARDGDNFNGGSESLKSSLETNSGINWGNGPGL